ncbi:MAG: hypothetical protein Q4Q06_04850 [Bacteroidota bacterium]|nr:hypothetical protein [Bacteroidota bacterium]
MKRLVILLACMFIFIGISTAQKEKNEGSYKQVEKELNTLQKLIDSKLYYSAYEKVESTMAVVKEEKQLKELFSKIQELKQLSPQKPESECSNLKEQMKKGINIPKETLFFYDCIKD